MDSGAPLRYLRGPAPLVEHPTAAAARSEHGFDMWVHRKVLFGSRPVPGRTRWPAPCLKAAQHGSQARALHFYQSLVVLGVASQRAEERAVC